MPTTRSRLRPSRWSQRLPLTCVLLSALPACGGDDTHRRPNHDGEDASMTGGRGNTGGAAATGGRGAGGATPGTGGELAEAGLVDASTDAGPVAGTLLRQVEWPGPVVLVEDMAAAYPSGAFVSLRIDGTSELAGVTLKPPPGQQATIVKLDDDANPLWTRVLEQGTGTVALVRVAGEPDGGVAFVASLPGVTNADVGGGVITTQATSESFVLARLDAAGDHVFSRTPDCTDYCGASSVAVDGTGNIAVGGFVRGTMTVDGLSVSGAGGERLAWLGVFTAAGKAKWLKAFAPGGNIPGLHFDGAARLVTLGYFTGDTTLDALPLHVGAAETGFLAAVSATDGKALWANTFGGKRSTSIFELSGNATQVAVALFDFDAIADGAAGGYKPDDGVVVTTYATKTGATTQATPVSVGADQAIAPDGTVAIVGTSSPRAVAIGGVKPAVKSGNDFAAGLDTEGKLTWSHDLGRPAYYKSIVGTHTGRTLVVRLPPLPDGGENFASVTLISGG